jgi:hypothetical protein
MMLNFLDSLKGKIMFSTILHFPILLFIIFIKIFIFFLLLLFTNLENVLTVIIYLSTLIMIHEFHFYHLQCALHV